MACQGKLSLHVLLALFVLLSSCKANTRSKTEAEALLKWKKSLPDQQILKSWAAHTNSSDSSPCKWHGIACNDEGSITEINLAYVGLRGNLQNLDFSSFPNLLHLDLGVNKLTSTIPVSVAWICHKPIKPNPAINWPNTSCIRNPTQPTLHKVIYIYIYIYMYLIMCG